MRKGMKRGCGDGGGVVKAGESLSISERESGGLDYETTSRGRLDLLSHSPKEDMTRYGSCGVAGSCAYACDYGPECNGWMDGWIW